MSTPSSPWFYFRDDLDLLEDGVDSIFMRHEQEAERMDEATHAMEDEVMEEQLKSEEDEEQVQHMVEQAWEASGALTFPSCDHDHSTCWLDDTRPLIDLLRDHQWQDPLYVRARRWAVTLFAWSGRAYERAGRKDRDLFRVHMNVCLVPAKIALACEEECEEDLLGWEIAGREFASALLYLDRCLESLCGFLHHRGGKRSLKTLVQEGSELRRLIAHQCVELEQRRRFHSRSV